MISAYLNHSSHILRRKNVKKRNVISTTDKNVQAGKTYQYRVLAYRVIKGKNIYSSKSKARKITLKTKLSFMLQRSGGFSLKIMEL